MGGGGVAYPNRGDGPPVLSVCFLASPRSVSCLHPARTSKDMLLQSAIHNGSKSPPSACA